MAFSFRVFRVLRGSNHSFQVHSCSSSVRLSLPRSGNKRRGTLRLRALNLSATHPAVTRLREPCYSGQYFALGLPAGFGHGILAVFVRLHGRGAVHRQLIGVRRVFVLVVEHVIERDFLPGVRGVAAERSHQAGHDTAIDFVVRFVAADGLGEQLPLVEIWIVRPLRVRDPQLVVARGELPL